MSLVSIIIVLLIFGAILYLIEIVPIDGTIKRVIHVIALLFLIIWVLRALAPSLGGLTI